MRCFQKTQGIQTDREQRWDHGQQRRPERRPRPRQGRLPPWTPGEASAAQGPAGASLEPHLPLTLRPTCSAAPASCAGLGGCSLVHFVLSRKSLVKHSRGVGRLDLSSGVSDELERRSATACSLGREAKGTAQPHFLSWLFPSRGLR